MALGDILNTRNNKIKANKARNSLVTGAASTSALPSRKLEKYKYLHGEELALELTQIEKTGF